MDFKRIIGIPKSGFQKLVSECESSKRKRQKLTVEEHLCLFLIFFRWDLPDVFLGLLFGIARSTAQEYRHLGLEMLSEILGKEIGMKDAAWRKENGRKIMGNHITMALDGSEQKCFSSKNPFLNVDFYSTKKNQPSVNILLAASPFGNRILYLSESYSGNHDDKACIVAESGVNKKMPYSDLLDEDELVIADEGFTGFYNYGKIWVPPKEEENPSRKEAAGVRIRIENVFSKIKKFRCCSQRIKIPIDIKNKRNYILDEHHKRWTVASGFINRDYIKY